LTQAALASKHGISPSLLSDWLGQREKFVELSTRGENLSAKRISNSEFSQKMLPNVLILLSELLG
jgi:transposase-like protein